MDMGARFGYFVSYRTADRIILPGLAVGNRVSGRLGRSVAQGVQI